MASHFSNLYIVAYCSTYTCSVLLLLFDVVFQWFFLIVTLFVGKLKLKHCLLAYNSKNAARSTGVISNLWPCECFCFLFLKPSFLLLLSVDMVTFFFSCAAAAALLSPFPIYKQIPIHEMHIFLLHSRFAISLLRRSHLRHIMHLSSAYNFRSVMPLFPFLHAMYVCIVFVLCLVRIFTLLVLFALLPRFRCRTEMLLSHVKAFEFFIFIFENVNETHQNMI